MATAFTSGNVDTFTSSSAPGISPDTDVNPFGGSSSGFSKFLDSKFGNSAFTENLIDTNANVAAANPFSREAYFPPTQPKAAPVPQTTEIDNRVKHSANYNSSPFCVFDGFLKDNASDLLTNKKRNGLDIAS